MTGPGPADLRWIRVEEPSAAAGCRSGALAMAERLGFQGHTAWAEAMP